jgi:hypothetical protein
MGDERSDAAAPTTDELVERFKTESPEETASWLERLLDVVRPGKKTTAPAGKAVRTIGRSSAVRYKGVSF